jgi:hypothetical protein
MGDDFKEKLDLKSWTSVAPLKWSEFLESPGDASRVDKLTKTKLCKTNYLQSFLSFMFIELSKNVTRGYI